MDWNIYKLIRESYNGGASGAYQINRDENWRMILVGTYNFDNGYEEIKRLTRTDPEWLKWEYNEYQMESYLLNPANIHRRTYHLIQRGDMDRTRRLISDALTKDGVDVQ